MNEEEASNSSVKVREVPGIMKALKRVALGSSEHTLMMWIAFKYSWLPLIASGSYSAMD